jgi:hypothetical protein
MLAAYGVDVLDPAVSTRRVWVLVNRLPPAARSGGEAWSVEADLLALVSDQLSWLSYITLKAHGAKNVPKPKPVPRPKRQPVLTVATPARPAERMTAGTMPRAGEPARKAGSWAEAARALASVPGVSASGV